VPFGRNASPEPDDPGAALCTKDAGAGRRKTLEGLEHPKTYRCSAYDPEILNGSEFTSA
jgi:hypothetical protein